MWSSCLAASTSPCQLPRDRYIASGTRDIPFGCGGRLRRGLANDGGYGRGGRRGFAARLARDDAALVPHVPALARLALLIGRKLGAVQIADEAHARAARAVGTAFHPAGHVERPPLAGLLGRQPGDPLRRDQRRKLSFQIGRASCRERGEISV